MHLDLSEIVMREGMRSDVEIDQLGVEDPDLDFARPLRGRLTFTNGGNLVSIEGRLQTVLRGDCSRCLGESLLPLDFRVEERFPIPEILQPQRRPPRDADFDPTISTVIYLDKGRPILDLDELMRQLVLAETPIRMLCEEECRGLCPGCGANLNREPCRCPERPAEGPLAALGALLEPDEPAPDRSADGSS